jgi:putative ABC transport system permease protein
VSALAQDVRYTLRTLRRSPGFTLVAILTLALGIGGTTAIFTVVDGVVLRELPYPAADRLVSIVQVAERTSPASFSPADYVDLKRGTRAFSAMSGYREEIVDLTGSGDPERLEAIQASSGFFDVFGAAPIIGRTFSESTDQPGGPRVAVIGEGLWKRRFGGRADVVGSTIRLNGQPTTILGVMPEWFRHPRARDLWVMSPFAVPVPPIDFTEAELLSSRDFNYFTAVARVRPDVSMVQANEEVRGIAARLAKEFPNTTGLEGAQILPLREGLIGDAREPMFLLLAAIAVVLLIACANVASLLLARGAGRRRELAVRTALGAGRARLMRQLLTESVVLAAVGGLFGVLLAFWLVDVLVTLAPQSTPRLGDVRFDWRVALFATACSTVVGIIFGLAPAMSGSSPSIGADLKDGGRSATTSRTGVRNSLVVAEVAMAVVLLVAAGMLLTSFFRLRSVDPGFRTTRLIAVFLPLPISRYDEAQQRRLYHGVLERLHAQPGTSQSAVVFPLPLTNANATSGYRIVGRDAQGTAEPSAEFGTVSPGYFETMGIPLTRGREFTEADTDGGQRVAIINQTLAEREWPGRDPVGETIAFGGSLEDKSSWVRVVGVVGDSKRRNLQTVPAASIYLPYQQVSLPYMTAVVRSDMGLAAIATAVRQAVQAIDPDLPIDDVYTIEQIIERSTGEPRFRAWLIAAFAFVALTLAVVGIYGLISYTVSQRVPEIGVRLALGATPADVRRLILGGGLKLAVLGVVIGLIGAVASVQALQGLLYSVSGTDPLVYAGVSSLLMVVSGLACWIPARRAMRVDPVVALRSE